MNDKAAIIDIKIVYNKGLPQFCTAVDTLGEIRVYDLNSFEKIVKMKGNGPCMLFIQGGYVWRFNKQ